VWPREERLKKKKKDRSGDLEQRIFFWGGTKQETKPGGVRKALDRESLFFIEKARKKKRERTQKRGGRKRKVRARIAGD